MRDVVRAVAAFLAPFAIGSVLLWAYMDDAPPAPAQAQPPSEPYVSPQEEARRRAVVAEAAAKREKIEAAIARLEADGVTRADLVDHLKDEISEDENEVMDEAMLPPTGPPVRR